jgi:hypothetical protein
MTGLKDRLRQTYAFQELDNLKFCSRILKNFNLSKKIIKEKMLKQSCQ